MLRIYFMQQWFTLSDPAMEEVLHDIALFREFAQLSWAGRLPDKSTILRFRHLLERHKLADQIVATVNDVLTDKGLMPKAGTVEDATLINAPSTTENSSGRCDPEMHQTKKGNQWFFCMKAHVVVDAHSGRVHTVRGTSGNVNDVVDGNRLLHRQESFVFADAGYQGFDKRADADAQVQWNLAMRPGKRRALDKTRTVDKFTDQAERLKAGIRAKMEPSFRVVKRHFEYVMKVRYRSLTKNTAQLKTLLVLSSLCMVRRKLLVLDGPIRPLTA